MNTRQVDGQSLDDIIINKTFSDAVNYCLDVLRRKKYFKYESIATMSRQSALFGQKLVELMENTRKELLEENSDINKKKSSINATSRFMNDKLTSKKTTTNEPISVITLSDSEDEDVSKNDVINIADDDDDDIGVVQVAQPAQDCPTPDPEPADGKDDNSTDDDDEDDPVTYHQTLVPYKLKFRVISLFKKNPSWPIKKLSGHSKCEQLKNRKQLERWEKQVEKYGSRKDWLSKINDSVFKKCIEHKKKKQLLTNTLLCKWALEVKNNKCQKKKTPFRFTPSESWLNSFKRHFDITGPAKNLKINNTKKTNRKSKRNGNNFFIIKFKIYFVLIFSKLKIYFVLYKIGY